MAKEIIGIDVTEELTTIVKTIEKDGIIYVKSIEQKENKPKTIREFVGVDMAYKKDYSISLEDLKTLIKDRIKELEDELEETNLCISDAEDTGKIKNGIKSRIEELKHLLGE